MTRHLLPCLPVLLLLAPVAQATPLALSGSGGTYFSIGPLLSVTRGDGESKLGLGAEATFNVLSGDRDIRAVGAFAQAQAVGAEYARLAGGFQATWNFVGLELGLMHQTASREHGPATGLHIAPYLTFVYGSVALRAGLPLIGPAGRHGPEVGLVFTLKLPFELDGANGPQSLF